ncbi:MAG TPA: GerMN domain-containing protein [Geobacteraceae bacterium]|nr:GerMN domain-containing protein [Geobacteraceae bacterium]
MSNVKHRRIRLILFIAFLVAATVLGALMLQKYYGKEDVSTTPVQPQTSGPVRVSLFFASPDGDWLVREGSEIDSCGNNLPACIRATLEKLVDGPLGDLAPTLPTTTIIHDVQVQGDTAYINVGKELADGLPGGSSAEMSAVYSIVNTVSFNFPDVKKVKFLLEGQDMESLKGHLDLRLPIEANFALEKDKAVQTGPPQQ